MHNNTKVSIGSGLSLILVRSPHSVVLPNAKVGSHQARQQKVTVATRWHYGWTILTLAGLINLASTTGHTSGIAPFTEHWIEELGVSRTHLSVYFTVSTCASVLLLPPAGYLIDRYGISTVLRLTFPLFAGGLIWQCFMTSRAELSATMIVSRVVNADVLCLLSQTAISKWFSRHLGKASLVFCVTNLMQGAFPAAVVHLILFTGSWRSAYRIITASLVAMLAPALFLLRDEPKALGLRPDFEEGQEPEAQGEAEGSALLSKESWTFDEVLRCKSFWFLILGTMVQNLVSMSYNFHMFGICAGFGLNARDAANIFLVALIVDVSFAIPLGWFVFDRMHRPHLLLAAGNLMTGLALVALLTTPENYVIFATLFGMGMGIFGSGASGLWARYFGPQHIGKIQSTVTAAIFITSGTSIIVFGYFADNFGPSRGYSLLTKGLIGAEVASALMTSMIPRPRLERHCGDNAA